MDTKSPVPSSSSSSSSAVIELSTTQFNPLIDIKTKEEENDKSFEEWSLCLNAADKHGVAYQLGALRAFHDLDLLRQFRFIHSTGMSNLLTAQCMAGLFSDSILLNPNNTIHNNNAHITKDYWYRHARPKFQYGTQSSQYHFVRNVYLPTLRWLKEDQEKLVWQWRVFAFWKWCKSWSSAFAEWISCLPYLADLPQCVEFASVDRWNPLQRELPIFTMSAIMQQQQSQVITWSSDRRVPVIGDNVDGSLPILQSMKQSLSTVDAWSKMLAASCIPLETPTEPVPIWTTGNTGASQTVMTPVRVQPAFSVDPYCEKPAHIYFQTHRGPQSAHILNNQRFIIIDAYNKSYDCRQSGKTGMQLTDRTLKAIRETSIQTRELSSSSPKELTRLALTDEKKGYFSLYRPDKVESWKWLRETQGTELGMKSLDVITMERLCNYGYYSITSQYANISDLRSYPLLHRDYDELFEQL